MEVILLHNTPLWVSDVAISKCYDTKCNRDKVNYKKIENVVNVSKHESTIEHISYNFEITGMSRACLQELVRHRIGSFSVKSTRFTLQELRDEAPYVLPDIPYEERVQYDLNSFDAFHRASEYIVMTGDNNVDWASIKALEGLRELIFHKVKRDLAKYSLPDCYKTSLVWTINARSLKNFIELRTSNNALWEARILSDKALKVVPEDHYFLFDQHIDKKFKKDFNYDE